MELLQSVGILNQLQGTMQATFQHNHTDIVRLQHGSSMNTNQPSSISLAGLLVNFCETCALP